MMVAIELTDGKKLVTGKLIISGITDLTEAKRQIITLLEEQDVSGDCADGPWDIRNVNGCISAENEYLRILVDDTMIAESIKHGSVEFVC